MKLGCSTTRMIVRTGGWINSTVGGSETLVKLILVPPPQPGAARAARSQNTSRRQSTARSELVRRINHLRVGGVPSRAQKAGTPGGGRGPWKGCDHETEGETGPAGPPWERLRGRTGPRERRPAG